MELQIITTGETARDKLLKDMKRTKGVRFNASKRIEETERKRTSNTAYASAAVVVLTLLPVFFPMVQWVENAIALSTVALSIFILASSLLQSANNGPVKADQFHRCALEVNSLRRELLAAGNTSVGEFSIRYDEILRRYNINHDPVDYEKYRLEHPDEFPAVAEEDNENARRAIKHTDQAADLMTKVITGMTAVLTILALGLPVTSDLINGVLKLMGLQQ